MSKPPQNELVVIDKPGQLYAHMQSAIAACYSVDDCEKIAKQADAIAAYFKQISDDDSVRRFLAVKLRAWRKIGEILCTVDVSECLTAAAQAAKIRKAFPDNPVVVGMTDYYIGNAVKLARLPTDFFEDELGEHNSISSMLASYSRALREEWEASPEGQAELQERRRQEAEARERYDKRLAKQAAEAAKQAKLEAEYLAQQAEATARDKADLDALAEARGEAISDIRSDVGFTMDRRDRERMKEVLFLIKASVHDVLRQAAFDHHMTMQAVLRAGLVMWLAANGYPFDPDDLKPRLKSPTPKLPPAPEARVS